MKNEQVLVVPEEFCHLDMFEHTNFATRLYTGLDNPANSDTNYTHLEHNLLPHSFFMDRAEAEQNPKFKQLIPYCIIKRLGKAYNEYFVYQRTKKAGETRLHGNWSVGIGGHISLSQDYDINRKLQFYHQNLLRELQEETNFDEKINQKLLGFIYDDSNDVGKVHLGLIHEVLIINELKIKEDHLCNGQFQSFKEMDYNINNFENWSKILIKNKVLEVI